MKKFVLPAILGLALLTGSVSMVKAANCGCQTCKCSTCHCG